MVMLEPRALHRLRGLRRRHAGASRRGRRSTVAPGRSPSPTCPLTGARRPDDPVRYAGTVREGRSHVSDGGDRAGRLLVIGPSSNEGGVGAAGTTTTVPQPAGKYPSAISKMVCASEARREISEALGLKPTKVSTPTWVAHLYSCAYVYANGSFTLSVKELSSWSQTLDYFTSLRASSAHRLGGQPRAGRLQRDRRLGGGPQGLEGPDRRHHRPARAVRLAAHQLGGHRRTVRRRILGCWAGD